MKVREGNILDIESAGGDMNSIEAGIDFDNLGFIFDIVSTQMYKDPIGSIVREYTSNAFDSHIEAKVKTPVKIGGGKDSEGVFITFEDFGKGMSVRRIRKVFMKYFSSTKSSTNDMIGGYGIGSKSAMSYTSLFYIRSRYRGYEHKYALHKGEKLPTLEILENNRTTEHNGVEIKIYMNNLDGRSPFSHGSEENKFLAKMKEQLAYFDNVYIDNFWQINNNYTIFEGNYFKYRPDNSFGGMHIVLGRVYYPIDWQELGLSYIEASVAVKFEIGELQVTPNRESLRYNDNIKALVIDRIEKVCEELRLLYRKQIPDITDYQVWLGYSRKKPYITFTNKTTEGLITNEWNLQVSSIPGISNNIPFKPFEDLGIKVNPDNPYPEYMCDERVDYKGITQGASRAVGNIFNEKMKCILQDKMVNKETNTYLAATYLYQHNTPTNSVYLIKRVEKTINEYKKIIGFEKTTFGQGKEFMLYAKKVHAYKKIMRDEIIKTSSASFGIGTPLMTYSSVQPSEQWIKEYRLKVKLESEAYKRKINKIISYKDFTKYRSTGTNEAKYDVLCKNNILIIYGGRDDENELLRVGDLLKFRYTLGELRDNYHKKVIGSDKKLKVIQTAMSNFPILKEYEHGCYVKDFYSDNRLFKDLATAFKIRELLNGITNVERYADISTFVYDKLIVLKQHHDKYNWENISEATNRKLDSYKDDVLNLAKARGLWDTDLLNVIDDVELWFTGVEFLKFTVINKESEQFVVNALKKAKKRINSYWYHNPTRIDDTGTQGILCEEGEHRDFLDVTYNPNYSFTRKQQLLQHGN